MAPVSNMERYDGAYGSKDVVSTFYAAMQDVQVLRLNYALAVTRLQNGLSLVHLIRCYTRHVLL